MFQIVSGIETNAHISGILTFQRYTFQSGMKSNPLYWLWNWKVEWIRKYYDNQFQLYYVEPSLRYPVDCSSSLSGCILSSDRLSSISFSRFFLCTSIQKWVVPSFFNFPSLLALLFISVRIWYNLNLSGEITGKIERKFTEYIRYLLSNPGFHPQGWRLFLLVFYFLVQAR